MRPRSTISITFTAVVVSLGVLAQAATVRSVDVLRYTAPGGETYFALPLESPGAKASTEEVAGRDIVILVDTSASQVGDSNTSSMTSANLWACRLKFRRFMSRVASTSWSVRGCRRARSRSKSSRMTRRAG